ncbi:MAG TPA: hypothetical protein VLY03_00200 [Bacteroidota bacterium]|nr:hypothetical protein [Bacteroidota bacterium]
MCSTKLQVFAAGVCVLLLTVANMSCTPYDFSSPSPGEIKIQLKTISSPDHIPFLPLNNFGLTVSILEGVETNGNRVPIYSDIQAIKRNPIDYNTLDYRARDSDLVIGAGYAPPGDYLGIDITAVPDSQVVLNGYQVVGVTTPYNYNPNLRILYPFKVEESKLTTITLTVDLDQSLVKGFVTYHFTPYYYISRVTVQ